MTHNTLDALLNGGANTEASGSLDSRSVVVGNYRVVLPGESESSAFLSAYSIAPAGWYADTQAVEDNSLYWLAMDSATTTSRGTAHFLFETPTAPSSAWIRSYIGAV